MADATILNRKLKLGMVGGGRDAFIGAVHRRAVLMDGKFEFVAGALSASPEKARLSGQELWLDPTRVYTTYQEMAEKEAKLPVGKRIDLVAIVTPNHLHFPIAKTFLEAGFHVVCDKPMTFNLEEALALKKVVERTGKIFALTHNYTGYPMVKQARHLVKTGVLGRIRKIVVEYPQEWLRTLLEAQGQKQAQWRTDPTRAGAAGCLGDIGSHCENLVHYITGLEPAEVCADLTTFVEARLLDDDVNILLHFKGGARGVLHASQICTGDENNLSIRVWGTEAGLEWHQEHPNYLYVYYPNSPVHVYRRGHAYLCDAAKRATRLPSGHPEAFIEAFANIYLNAGDAMRAVEAATTPGELELDFPNVDDGIRGMVFISTVIKSNQSSEKWTKMIL
ncbi:Gfo/Idh/MocA family oxidoreductase [candidate division KSB1 bacterium]|nr:Gfo/Idh/MocA family oxidoreductase [candidate division KSB1 bacterium]